MLTKSIVELYCPVLPRVVDFCQPFSDVFQFTLDAPDSTTQFWLGEPRKKPSSKECMGNEDPNINMVSTCKYSLLLILLVVS